MLTLRGPVPKLALAGGILIWLAGLTVAWGYLLKHAYTPAKAALALRADEQIPATSEARLILFVHPFCPCTGATLSEFSESLAKYPAHTSVKVVFVTAGLDDADVQRSPHLKTVRALPNIDVAFDDTGELAARYQAEVSGELVAFDQVGQLTFRGGITSARGHRGESPGKRLFEACLQDNQTSFCSSPVYGCKLPGP